MGKYDHVIGTEVASGTWSWDSDRALLYAVGVGVGLEDNQAELHFSTENTPGQPQQVIPTFAALMGDPGNWIEALDLPTKHGITLADSDELLATVEMRLFAQGLGGFGGPRTPPGDQPWEYPERAPDATVS